jgi:hypothetical protein
MAEWGHGDVEGTWAADCEVCGWHATFDSRRRRGVRLKPTTTTRTWSTRVCFPDRRMIGRAKLDQPSVIPEKRREATQGKR